MRTLRSMVPHRAVVDGSGITHFYGIDLIYSANPFNGDWEQGPSAMDGLFGMDYFILIPSARVRAMYIWSYLRFHVAKKRLDLRCWFTSHGLTSPRHFYNHYIWVPAWYLRNRYYKNALKYVFLHRRGYKNLPLRAKHGGVA